MSIFLLCILPFSVRIRNHQIRNIKWNLRNILLCISYLIFVFQSFQFFVLFDNSMQFTPAVPQIVPIFLHKPYGSSRVVLIKTVSDPNRWTATTSNIQKCLILQDSTRSTTHEKKNNAAIFYGRNFTYKPPKIIWLRNTFHTFIYFSLAL